MGMGTEWAEPAPVPAAQRKVAGGRMALKLLLSVLLAGLALRLLADHSASYHLPPTASPEEAAALAVTAPAPARDADGEISPKGVGRCDLFHGEWVPDSSGPAYNNASCRFIEIPQNCMTNGRPDDGYLYWRWKPYGCDIVPFDGKTFLEGMRGKHWALVGDLLLRNHVQSLLCLLSKVEVPTEVYHDRTYKSRRWHFPSHNFMLSLVWAPFLIKADIFEDDNGVSSAAPQLHFGNLDTNWMSQWDSFDYVVISTGQWFFKIAVYLENGSAIGCHYCQDKNLREITTGDSFRRALRDTFQFITKSPHKPVVFYRTWSPSHFENGEWSSGGTCNRTVPFKPRQSGDRAMDNFMWRIERAEFAKAVADDGASNAGRLKLLDTFELSLLRPDGHAGPYRAYDPFGKGSTGKIEYDCLGWCLPGPIDTWNDIIMQMLGNDLKPPPHPRA